MKLIGIWSFILSGTYEFKAITASNLQLRTSIKLRGREKQIAFCINKKGEFVVLK